VTWYRLIVLAGGLCAGAAPASGQQTFFLRPEVFRTPGPVAVHLEADGKPVPWDDSRVRWLFIRGQGTQENRDQAPSPPDQAAGSVALPGPPPGAATAGVDLIPRIEEIDAAALREFAASHCEDRLPADVQGKVRVNRVQSCKTILRVGEAPWAHEAATSETLQAAEIVIQMDPTTAKVGSDALIVTSVGGEDVEDQRVLVTEVATGTTGEIHTKEEGRGVLHFAGPGLYQLEFHHLAKAVAGSSADWTLTTATLTFEVPQAAPPAPTPPAPAAKGADK
jgi:hypothetical protein